LIIRLAGNVPEQLVAEKKHILTLPVGFHGHLQRFEKASVGFSQTPAFLPTHLLQQAFADALHLLARIQGFL